MMMVLWIKNNDIEYCNNAYNLRNILCTAECAENIKMFFFHGYNAKKKNEKKKLIQI